MTDKLGNRNSTILFLLLCKQKYLVCMTLYYIILHYELASIFIQPCFTYQLDLLHLPLFVPFSWQYLIRCISLLIFAQYPTKQVYFSLFIVLTVHISLLIYSKYLFYSEIRSYKSQHDLNWTLLFTTSLANNNLSKYRYLLPYFCHPLWCMIFLFNI